MNTGFQFWVTVIIGAIYWTMGSLWGFYVGRQSGRRDAMEEMRTKPIADDPESWP